MTNKKLLLNYEKKWVALSSDEKRIIASDTDVEKLGKKLEKLKVKKTEAILTWVFPFSTHIAPSNAKLV